MKEFLSRMSTSKTFWTGVTVIVSASGAYFTGQIDLGSFIQTVTTALIGIFLKDAVVKNTGQ